MPPITRRDKNQGCPHESKGNTKITPAAVRLLALDAVRGGRDWNADRDRREQGSAGGGAAGKEAELVVSSFCKGRKSCADAIHRSICIGMDFDAVWTDTFSSLAQFPGGDVVVILITLAAGWIGYLIRPI